MKYRYLALALLAAAAVSSCSNKQQSVTLTQGAEWLADDSVHINAHGGNIIKYNDAYYWYGENRRAENPTSNGVSVYRSTDLANWQNLGLALEMSDSAGHDLERGGIIERPKVVYNPRTGKFVMWFHLELKGRGYSAARSGVAVSDTPEGPFTYNRSGRVNPGVYPINMTEKERALTWDSDTLESWSDQWKEAVAQGMFNLRDHEGGQMARDMTIFIDEDSTAYHIYSSEENLTLNIAELTDDYLGHTGRYIRVDPAGHNEAPAIFKKDGRYWMITSGCTGWAPNEARLLTATDIMGDWERLPNPCTGPDAEITFKGQSTYVLPLEGVDGAPTRYIAMFDVWHPHDLGNSRHLWIPIEFTEDGTPTLPWVDTVTVP